jgi:hypothetical protein
MAKRKKPTGTVCKDCGTTLSQKGSYSRASVKSHKVKGKLLRGVSPYACGPCGKPFMDMCSLTKHYNICKTTPARDKPTKKKPTKKTSSRSGKKPIKKTVKRKAKKK